MLKVSDLMAKGDENPFVDENTLLIEAISVMSKKGLGVVSIVNENGFLKGIITDGDLRRIIEKRVDLYNVKVSDVMIRDPKKYKPDKLAVDALHYIKENSINNLPIVDDNNIFCGTITWQMIIRAGIVI